MLLSKLEIKGFKSFGDKITINFDRGITGIVGPNGCGKSNIVDAIRWVLGEQKTRMLRSEKMENIIFNGTKKRKPLQMAEVSLTFDNTKNLLPTEYSQVTITRRYYRSGDSEYLLNGVTCRLKDITNLFLDTGIASNTYAIIELKMVDDILQDKDNSRRDLFEEAAGIAKFKKRKKETIKKLADTDADLDRVEDLLFEIEKNLKSLEKQARQAEKYYQLKEEYKQFSIALARKSVATQHEALQRIGEQIDTEKDRKLSVETAINRLESELQEAKAQLVSKEKTLASRQKTLNEYVAKIRQYENEKQIGNERLRFLNDRSDNLRNQIAQDKDSSNRAQTAIKSLQEEIASAHRILDEIQAKRDQLEAAYKEQKEKTQSLQSQYNALNEEIRQLKDQYYQNNKSLEIKNIQLQSLREELEKTSSNTSEQHESLKGFDQKIGELDKDHLAKRDRLQKFKQEEERIQSEIQQTEKTIEVIREELAQTSRNLDARENEYELTKSLVDNLEGFPEAIKFLRKEKKWGKRAPLLSDILTCPEEYRVTIENFLEPFMNYYIVETASEAYQAVNLLNDASKGKAHFFVLDSFKKYHPGSTQLFNNTQPATEVVEYDEKYKKLVSYLLDNVYIVAGDESQIPADENSIFITKSGKVTKKRHMISGGSIGLFEGKRIGRAKNLEKLESTIKKLRRKQDQIKENLSNEQADLEQLRAKTRRRDIEEAQEELNRLSQDLVSVKTKQEQYKEMLSSQALKKEDIEEQIMLLEKETAELSPQVKKEQQLLEEKESQQTILHGEVDAASSILTEKSAAYNEENILFHQQENKVSSIDQEISFKQSAQTSAAERIAQNEELLQKTDAEVKELLQRANTSEDELVNMYKEKETIEAGVNEAEKTYYSSRGTIDEIENKIRESQRQKGQIDTLLMELQNEQNEKKLELTSVKERLSVEFNVNIEEVMKQPAGEIEEKFDETSLREKTVRIKERMENMGPINPMAMEAYEEIKERHDFITSQKADLLEAKDSLLSTIEEIDTVARETFTEAFEKIKENFVEVFRTLFTDEDDCDLRLAEPDNPLESSIEIIAKPKGKRPLTINQLSGGEKTLTATSLLFAIYLLKPAPFCIFDEVDAPLDDANIDKFNQIIKRFSEESQFIIVTHNKRTMASTDIIYGITMVEQGVSRVVPVDLRELV